jgi:hypothetical protein
VCVYDRCVSLERLFFLPSSFAVTCAFHLSFFSSFSLSCLLSLVSCLLSLVTSLSLSLLSLKHTVTGLCFRQRVWDQEHQHIRRITNFSPSVQQTRVCSVFAAVCVHHPAYPLSLLSLTHPPVLTLTCSQPHIRFLSNSLELNSLVCSLVSL